MKRVILGSEILFWVLLVTTGVALTTTLALALVYAGEFSFLYIPFASWYVFGLSGLMLALAGLLFFWWWQLRQARTKLAAAGRELLALKRPPLADEIPAVCGHEQLRQADFMPIIQMLFRRPPDVQYIHVQPLPGGYGESTVLLVRLQRQAGAALLPRSFVIKLGNKQDMAGEYDKFHNHVLVALAQAPKFFRHAERGSLAGIAYEFAGQALEADIQSFQQFFQGHAASEIAALVQESYAQLAQAWYRRGRVERTDLYAEYSLLAKKQAQILGAIGEITAEDDPYRANFSAAEERLRPHLKPGFCPDPLLPWYDPVAFLRSWSRRTLALPLYRSTIHGDLNARNILVEIGPAGSRRVWFIDFSHTGNGLSAGRTAEAGQAGSADSGSTLRDFCRLEADIKFILTRLQDENDLQQAASFEKQLLAGGLALADLTVTPPPDFPGDEKFRKAWQVIRALRCRAAAYLSAPDDLRPYYAGLLHATLPIVYYHATQFDSEAHERQQKRYALIAAGMLCSQL